MKRVFCDTSGLYAVVEPSDSHHNEAKAAWQTMVDAGVSLLTISYVVVETLAIVQRRSGMAKAQTFARTVSALIETHFVDRTLHAAALNDMLLQKRRYLSLVDCASFAFMQRHGIDAFFGFDRHFIERGFTPFTA